MKGYRKAMKEAGITVKEGWVVSGDFDIQGGEKAARKIIQKGVTAIFAGNDIMAYGTLRAAHTLGKKIPQDIALVGMDDLELSTWMNPSLTTVRYDIETMAALAAKFAIRQIQSPLIQKSHLGTPPKPQLIVRDTCGAKK